MNDERRLEVRVQDFGFSACDWGAFLGSTPREEKQDKHANESGLAYRSILGKKGFFVYPSPNPWPISRLCPKDASYLLGVWFRGISKDKSYARVT